MCRSKAEGGRRCPGGGHSRAGTAGNAQVGTPAEWVADHLRAEIRAAAGLLGGGDAQYALEEAVSVLRRAYVDAGRLGPLGGGPEALRARLLDVAEAIDAGLDDEHQSRQDLREAARNKLRDLAAAAGAAPSQAAPGGDDADYLRRAAALDARVAAGESIDDIMRAEQLARGEARIREIIGRR